jgi:hypothetical protein
MTCKFAVSLVVAALIIMATLFGRLHAGEIVDCAAAYLPGERDSWSYRTKIPGYGPGSRNDKCWYEGPPMKPRNELRWPMTRTKASKAEQPQAPVSPRYGTPAAAPAMKEVVPNESGHGSAVGRAEDNATLQRREVMRNGGEPKSKGDGSSRADDKMTPASLEARALSTDDLLAITYWPELATPLPKPRPVIQFQLSTYWWLSLLLIPVSLLMWLGLLKKL